MNKSIKRKLEAWAEILSAILVAGFIIYFIFTMGFIAGYNEHKSEEVIYQDGSVRLFDMYKSVEDTTSTIKDTVDVVANELPLKVDNLDKGKDKIKITDAEYEELAKIIFCEAGGEDFDGKVLVGNVIMNRVNSDQFPNDIISVIRQNRNGVYQFSPVGSGKIDRITPTEDCYKAVDSILDGYDISQGALYFESCEGESWHSRNLEFMFKHGCHRFYR